ncbi:DUF2934 domain-containing protein [Aureimonas populi]|uniref:DUF2934 domain-containing protein n=1 Tax=Aureimonas populi TaxID=1701758 RepID=A0ABW5CK31_9HYPH|nr:DUF2934 domain-containing protein [Aureimonas populi]
MANVDNSEKIRDRAYFLWEKAGRPCGREHEFWAQAAQEIEGDVEAEREAQRESRIVAR